MNNIGTCYAEMGQIERARSAFQESIEFIPEGVSYPDPMLALKEMDS